MTPRILKMSAIGLSVIVVIFLIVLLYLYNRTYSLQIPVNDDQYLSTVIAFASVENDRPLASILQRHFGHRFVVNNTITYLSATFDDWNLQRLSLINFAGGIVMYLLSIALVALYDKRHIVAVIIPLGLLIFSLRPRDLWLIPLWSSWHLFVIWTLLIAIVIKRMSVGRQQIVALTLLAIINTFTISAGLASWMAIAVILPLIGYKNWRVHAYWYLLFVIVFYLYMDGIDRLIHPVITYPDYDIYFSGFQYLPINFAVYYGTVLSTRWALPMGVGIMALFVVNFVFYIKNKQLSRDSAVWIMLLALSCQVVLLKHIGRQDDGLLYSRLYWVTPALIFWIMTLILCYLNIVQKHFPKRFRSLLVAVNITSMIVIALLNSYSTYLEVQYARDFYDGVSLQLNRTELLEHETCALNIILEDLDCLDELTRYPLFEFRFLKLYDYGLTIYAEYDNLSPAAEEP